MQIKHLLVLLLMITTPYFCYGDGYDDTYNKLKQDSTFSPLIKYEEFIEHLLPVIEARMMQIDSELVEATKNDTKEQKIVKYNNRLAQKVFDDYKNYFFEDIKKKSKETGRKIQPDGEIKPGAEQIWLDRGEYLESDACNGGTYKAKDSSEKERVKERRDHMEHTCLYPDGYEEYYISCFDDTDRSFLEVYIEDKLKNISESYTIVLNRYIESDSQNEGLHYISLDISKQTRNYNEDLGWRNAMQQYIKDGGFMTKGTKSPGFSIFQTDFKRIRYTDEFTYKDYKSTDRK